MYYKVKTRSIWDINLTYNYHTKASTPRVAYSMIRKIMSEDEEIIEVVQY